MTEITDLNQIKQIETEILRRFSTVCSQNGLRFFLSNGTLLGAVKYGGFIPWDDDIDVFMPRADYERLMQVDEIDEGPFRLMSRERVPAWRLPFAKLCDRRTVKREGSADFGAEYGLEIDIFPLDVWSGGKGQAFRCGLWRRGLSAAVKERFETPKSGWRRAVLYGIWRLSRALGVPFFLRMINREVSRGRKLPKPAYLGSVAWSLYGMREYIPAECFDETVTVSFEGGDYPAPAGYDAYLRSMYGDYRLDPPPEKQVTHHFFRVWKKENNV